MKWQEPPNDRRRSTDYGEIVKKLKQHPNRWALIREGGNASMTTHIKTGRYKDFAPPGSFEATSRRDPEGTVKIWARYIGEK